jgi:hypothetical protein
MKFNCEKSIQGFKNFLENKKDPNLKQIEVDEGKLEEEDPEKEYISIKA